MTDRIHTLTVVLAHDARDEDVINTCRAIQQLRGVIAVHNLVADPATYMAEQRALEKLRGQLRDILWPKLSE